MYAFQFSSYDKNNFHKKLPNFESGTSLKPQISQKIFTSDFMLPDRNFFSMPSTHQLFHHKKHCFSPICNIFPPKNTFFLPNIYMKCHTDDIFIEKSIILHQKITYWPIGILTDLPLDKFGTVRVPNLSDGEPIKIPIDRYEFLS